MATVVRTSCNRDCPDACGVLAHVEHGRVVRIQGDPAHPVTQGFLCARTNRFLARQYSPERLTAPRMRKQGELVPVCWEEALDACARKLLDVRRESGPAAIFHYRGGGSLGVLKSLANLLFERFGPVTAQRGSVCDGAGMAAQLADFGDSDCNDLFDLRNAKSIVLWGKNPAISSPHLLPLLAQARDRGARIALVDPIRHRTASFCELVLQPRPGGDTALALGVARVVFDRGWGHPDAARWCDHLQDYRALVHARTAGQWALDAGVESDALERLAEQYACHGPSTILVGWGMQRRTQGATIVRAIDALGAITGNVGIAGGGVSFYAKRRAAFDLSVLQSGQHPPRVVREPLFASDLIAASDPPIRAVWISCANPVVMLPDSAATAAALSSRELVVVVDSFLTDTAKAATVVLPCTTFLEDDDLVGAYGHHYMGVVRPAMAPPPGVKTDLEIVQELAGRLDLADVVAGTAEQWKQRLLRSPVLDDLERGACRSPVAPALAFAGRVFPTPSGKANLLCEAIAQDCRPDTAFPLCLMALSTAESQCSQWSPSEPHAPLVARVHPSSCMGIGDGELARLTSSKGALVVQVRHDGTVREGLVVVPKGGSPSLGRGANLLVTARLTDRGEGAALYEQPVRLDPAPGG